MLSIGDWKHGWATLVFPNVMLILVEVGNVCSAEVKDKFFYGDNNVYRIVSYRFVTLSDPPALQG